MPTWSNTDVANSKPKFAYERQTRESVQLTTANVTAALATTIQLSGIGSQGVVAGQYAYAANLSSNGYGGMFASNNTVLSTSGNLITFATGTFGTIPTGTTIEFDTALSFPIAKPVANTYNKDTVLVTPTRLANNTVAMGDLSTGWVHIQKKTNNGVGGDSAVRYIHETLVCLKKPVASNTNSGNTSFGQMFTGI